MALGRSEQQLVIGEPRGRIDPKAETCKHANRLAINQHAIILDLDWQQTGVRPKLLHQHRGAAIDETL
ncbi:MAG: hypothetical protein ACK44Y_11555, partial [Novosphingobium sp.]